MTNSRLSTGCCFHSLSAVIHKLREPDRELVSLNSHKALLTKLQYKTLWQLDCLCDRYSSGEVAQLPQGYVACIDRVTGLVLPVLGNENYFWEFIKHVYNTLEFCHVSTSISVSNRYIHLGQAPTSVGQR